MALGVSISFDTENGVVVSGIAKTARDCKGKSLLKFLDEYIVLDLETTGLDPAYDEIIEVAALKYSNGVKIGEFTTLVKPDDEISEYITELTGISNEMVNDAPKIKDVLLNLKSYIGNSIIVAHNANFDINFLYDNYMHYMGVPFTNDFIDTMRISRRLFKDIRHRLIDLINEFNISTGNLHRSLADCEATQKIYEYMRQHCIENGVDIAAFNKSSHAKSFTLKDFKPTTEEFDSSHPIYANAVCFTGKLEKFERKVALQIVTNLGGIPTDSVTKKTNILVLGNNDYCSSIKGGKSRKQKKAEELILKGQDLIIISEKAFYDMI